MKPRSIASRFDFLIRLRLPVERLLLKLMVLNLLRPAVHAACSSCSLSYVGFLTCARLLELPNCLRQVALLSQLKPARRACAYSQAIKILGLLEVLGVPQMASIFCRPRHVIVVAIGVLPHYPC